MHSQSAIRIVLAEMPGLMRGLVRDVIKDQPDMGIVAEISRNVDVADSVANGQCDVVVAALSSDSRVPAAYQALLFADIPVPFIVLDPDGSRFQAFGRTVRRQFAGKELLAVIRRLANPDVDTESPDSIRPSVNQSKGSTHVI